VGSLEAGLDFQSSRQSLSKYSSLYFFAVLLAVQPTLRIPIRSLLLLGASHSLFFPQSPLIIIIVSNNVYTPQILP